VTARTDRTRWRSLLGTLLVAASGLAPGCEQGSLSAPAPAACAESGAQCRLPEGPLGVCERAPCGPGATAPCFQCGSNTGAVAWLGSQSATSSLMLTSVVQLVRSVASRPALRNGLMVYIGAVA